MADNPLPIVPRAAATTDFAIMYLATEGLYAEILRQPGLVDDLQQSVRIVVAGRPLLQGF